MTTDHPAPPRGDASRDPRVVRSRARVLDTAAALVRERGLGAVTIEVLVERSGVARSTIYRHWATRSDVVGATLEHMLSAALSGTGDVAPAHADASSSLGDRLRAALGAFVGSAGSGESVGLVPLLLVEAGRDPEQAGFRDRLLDRLTEALIEALAPAIEQGGLRPDVTLDDAVAWLLGPVVVRRFIGARGVDDEFVERTVAAFLRAHANASDGDCRAPGAPLP